MDAFDALAETATEAAEEARRRRGNGHATEAEWPEPDRSILSLHREPAPPFPAADVLGPFWAGWCAAAAEGKGCPPDFVAMPLLAAASGLLANVRRGRPWRGWTEATVLWAGSVGLPSSGKSPGTDAVRDLLSHLEDEWNRDFDGRQREHRTTREHAAAKREAWEKEVRAAVKKGYPAPEEPEGAAEPEPPELRRLLTTDVTVEKAARLSAANPRGLALVRDELAGWLGSMDKYGGSVGSDRAFWLEAHGGRPHNVDRVKDARPVRVPMLSLAICGGIQPDRLASLLLAGDDDGLAARFLLVWPERVPPKRPETVPDDNAAVDALRRLRELPQDLHEGCPRSRAVPFGEAAAGELQRWRGEVAAMEAEAERGLLTSWLGKLPGTAVRLALVFEYLWWCGDRPGTPEPEEVSENAVLAAVGFLESYAVPMARRCFGEAALPQHERDATSLARWLGRQAPLPERVNARELRHAGALPTREAERYDRALAELAEAGWVREAPARAGETFGRRRKDWAVNPAIGGARCRPADASCQHDTSVPIAPKASDRSTPSLAGGLSGLTELTEQAYLPKRGVR